MQAERCPQRKFAIVNNDASAPCPVCGTVFSARIALLRHLCDSRRSTCWTQILATPGRFAFLSDAKLLELDDNDRKARKAGRQAGHSHAVIPGGCVRQDGTPCGRASA